MTFSQKLVLLLFCSFFLHACGVLVQRPMACDTEVPFQDTYQVKMSLGDHLLYLNEDSDTVVFELIDNVIYSQEMYYSDDGCACNEGSEQIWVNGSGDSIAFYNGARYLYSEDAVLDRSYVYVKIGGDRWLMRENFLNSEANSSRVYSFESSTITAEPRLGITSVSLSGGKSLSLIQSAMPQNASLVFDTVQIACYYGMFQTDKDSLR